MKLIYMMLLLTVSFSVWAEEESKDTQKTTSLEIIVIDAISEDPLPAAKITLEKTSLQAFTDFDGYAEFPRVAEGQYDVEVSFTSYQKKKINGVVLDKTSKKLVISLEP